MLREDLVWYVHRISYGLEKCLIIVIILLIICTLLSSIFILTVIENYNVFRIVVTICGYINSFLF